MSFYQPSLSLYDVLDALTNKASAGESYEDNAYRPRQPQRRTLYGRQDPFYGRRQGHIPGSQYYSVPEASYYQPVYYTDEDVQRQRRPAHHHHHLNPRRTAAASRRPADTGASDGVVEALLNALTGGNADFLVNNSDETDQRERGKSEEEEQEKLNAAELAAVEQGVADSRQEEPLENERTSGGESDKQAEAKPEDEPTAASEGEQNKKRFTYENKGFNSPIPTPLQVSNPELRLDLPFSPEVNVYDTDEQYIVVLALPGANSKEFKIDFHPSSHELLVKGTIENKLGIDKKHLQISELKYGDFERSVKFPVLPRIEDEKIKASYFNGLLQIKVPKIPQDASKPQPKKRIVIEEVPDEELVFEAAPRQ
ncbi:unnamed protein product [Kluyveromyces dobzhanskii CBS 2104]|uniref:WGS project CCBQ000000000 data, contig 00102 n=1 Tax=Kluyveromyces dobzhanskii CBS 2104 TaxID=1427455 RepID=A0A0A8L553_9SACH|nr:unnamed protein product [Kluyveromyces dobzhanskii CBS 2104]